MSQTATSPSASPSASSNCDLAGYISIPLRLALGGLFLYAAFNKLQPPNGPKLFSAAVEAFKIPMGDFLTRMATSVTPWIEVLAGVCLVLGIWTRAAAVVLSALLLLFIVLLVSVLLRHLNVECGCFGDISPFCPKKVGLCHIVQDGLMLGAGLVIAATPRHRLALTK